MTAGPSTAQHNASPGSPLEESLVAEIERLLGRSLDTRTWGRLGEALKALHQRFVSEEQPGGTGTTYFTAKESLAAYLGYFFLSSAGQVRRALAEVSLPTGSPLKVLDVGSGPGPAVVAVAEAATWNGQRVQATALEAAPLALSTLTKLWRKQWGALETKEWRAGQPLPEGPYDVIVASHVLNELFLDDPTRLDKRLQLASELGKRLSSNGIMVLMEPALRRTGRELLVLRDRLLQQGYVALAPCFYQGACPAIVRPRDWCHADRPWTPPALVERAGEAAGLSRDTLKYTYVILAKQHPTPTVTKDAALFRVVSDPLPEKGKLRYFGCGPSGRHALVRLDKDASELNTAFSTLQRGDVVRTQQMTTSGDGKRIGVDSPVTVECAASARDLKPS